METYADWLRGRDDDDLRELLSARPELISPVPADLTALAARATGTAAVGRALDRLDRFSLAVLEAMVVLPEPITHQTLLAALHGTGARLGDVRSTAGVLLGQALIWQPSDVAAKGRRRIGPLRAAPGVRHGLPRPAGLGPPALEAFVSLPLDRLVALVTDLEGSEPSGFADVRQLAERVAARLADPADLIDDAGPEAREALDRLTWGPPVGRLDDARRAVRIETAESPIDRLLARGLLIATDDRTVALPREIGLHLREGRLFRDVTARPPELHGDAGRAAHVPATAAGHAFTVVRQVEELLERWGARPPGVLRTGGLGVRDLRAATAQLDVPEWQAALLIEVAYAAGLLARDGGEWRPTGDYDVWRMRGIAERWVTLVTGWLHTDRVPGLAGERDERDRPANALSAEWARPGTAELRVATLRILAAAPDGTAPDPAAVLARLGWSRPRRRGESADRLARWTLREAEVLGCTGFGALAPHARALLADGSGRGGGGAAAVLAPLLPEPLDKVLIQADLTAVAPGPLTTELGHELKLVADVESTGGATVYRFTPESVRRALDAGRSASGLIDLLGRHSATPLPQPLTYMIEDVARRHGRLRVGAATSYLRTDDPSMIDEILAHRDAGALLAHRVAPTVLASRLSPPELLEGLRTMGFAPVSESPEGGMMPHRTVAHRATSTAGPADAAPIDEIPDAAVIAATIRALRAGDEAARHGAAHAARTPAPDGTPPRSPAMATVDALRAAIESGGRLWIGYLDQEGRSSSRIVEPVRVEGGFLTGYDATRAAVQRFALHRITGVAELDDRTAE